MTAKELRSVFNEKFGFTKWPAWFEVDAETYGNVCQEIFDKALEDQFPDVTPKTFRLQIAVGPSNGILYKGVELILKGRTP